MEEKDNKHDFLTVGDLESFADKVNRVVYGKEKPQDQPKTVAFDSTKFQTYISKPEDVPEDVTYQLADLFDENTHFEKTNTDAQQIGPSTPDKIKESLAVAYILENNIPVAGATLLDPTKQNYKGIIPGDYYALKSGFNLEDRVQQEFFEVAPDKHNLGLAQELKKTLEEVAPKMYVIVTNNDTDTVSGLQKNGYKFVAQFKTDWEDAPVQLWIN